jgi:hypothetical protein
MKRFIEGQDRSQVTLLPECLDDYIAEDNPVRVVDERIDDTHRVVFSDVVVEALGQQGDLASVLSLDESLHVAARSVALPSILPSCLTRSKRFHTASVGSRSLRAGLAAPNEAERLNMRISTGLSEGAAWRGRLGAVSG